MATDSKQDKNEYEFIQEQIVPKKRSRLRKLLFSIMCNILLALLFGLVTCVTIVLCFPGIQRLIDKEPSVNPISLTERQTPKPSPTIAPATTTPSPNPTVNVLQPEEEEDESLREYGHMYLRLSELAKKFSQSIVAVTSATDGIDWFNNPTEKTNVTSGTVILKEQNKIFLLVGYNKIKDANRLTVTFDDGFTTEATLLAKDEEIGIAIITVDTKGIPVETLENVQKAEFGESYAIAAGDPILALGSPNGYVNSVEPGIISNAINYQYITDYKVELFNTNIQSNPNGEGVIVNLSGEVIGIITHNFDEGLNKGLSTALGITRLRPIIDELMYKNRTYFGVVANDFTKECLLEFGIEYGIYVTEVQVDSPAFHAGLQSGDIILKMDGDSVMSVTSFYSMLTEYQPKEEVKITVIRTAKTDKPQMELTVTLDKREK